MKTGDHAAFAAKSDWDTQEGLSKREYFAGQALMGLMANPDYSYSADDVPHAGRVAVIAADALLAELAKTDQP